MIKRLLQLFRVLAILLLAVQCVTAQQSRQVLSGKDRARPADVPSSGTSLSEAASSGDDEPSPSPLQRRLREIESMEQQCLDEVNRLRRASGLRSLDFSPELLQVARDYSRRMAEEKFFSHVDPGGQSVKQRIERSNIRWRMVGENLASVNGYINPVAASLHGWMESPGHRSNILDPGFRLSAVGVWITTNGTVYFTEIFLRQ
jgi:uncharacterized protein YkwD